MKFDKIVELSDKRGGTLLRRKSWENGCFVYKLRLSDNHYYYSDPNCGVDELWEGSSEKDMVATDWEIVE